MMRRNLLAAAPAVAALASVAAGPAAATAPSPILDAARQIAALGRQYDKADVPGADWRALDTIWMQVWAHERVILDATPATILEATVVVMVAAGNLDTGSASDDAGEMVNRAMRATARAIRFLAGAVGVAIEDIGGVVYLPDSASSASMGRAA